LWSPSRTLNPLLCISIVVALCTNGTTLIAQTSGSFRVLEIQGNWQLYIDEAKPEQSRRLVAWDIVPGRSTIRVRTPSVVDQIIIIDTTNKIVERKECSNLSVCHQPITLPAAPPPQGADELMTNLWENLRQFWRIYLPSMHRLRARDQQSESVVVLKDKQIDVSAILKTVPEGRFKVEPYPTLSKQQVINAVEFKWLPTEPKLVSMGESKPGLYSITPANIQAAPRDFVILICSEQDYPLISSAFEKVRDDTASWTGVVKTETIHVFLRGYLAEVAKTMSAKAR
jgi:hypothetical protein